MTRFQICLKVILKNEGGKVDHKSDRGGRTAFGVTQRVYDDFRKAARLPMRDVWDIEPTEIEAIYLTYWKAAHCDYIPDPLDLQVFDAAVNHGASRAKKMLQRILGVDEDGVIGRETMRALHDEVVCNGVEELAQRYLDERARLFDSIIRRDPSQAVFAKGWTNRIDHMRALV